MNQPRKRLAKKSKANGTKALSAPKMHKPLPKRGNIIIGKIKGTYPYADNIHEIESSEFGRQPIGLKQKKKRSVKIISNILKRTGFNLLNEIGDEIIGKY